MAIIFDIETGPLPDVELLRLIPEFDEAAFSPPGPFDPADVRCGNLKDAAKIADKIEQARADHQKAIDNFPAELEFARTRHFETHKQEAALRPEWGQVLAVGCYWVDEVVEVQIVEKSEHKIIRSFWDDFEYYFNRKFIGFNCLAFDIPFLIRRSWILGVKVPETAKDKYNGIIDLAIVWACGQFNRQFTSLDNIARYLGIPGKNGEAVDFARLWHGTEEERQQAIDYLANDLRLIHEVAKRLQVI